MEVDSLKAVKFMGKGKVCIVEKEKPVAIGNIAVVKVTSSGICGTDLELLLPSEEPVEKIAGHEVTGIVTEINRNDRFKVGDKVIVNCHVTCGSCEHCRNGDLIFCPDLKAIGFEIDGGNAEYLAVPVESLRPLPPDISDELGVIIGDALGTPYHAVKKADIRPGEYVAIFGVGPLGQMAVMVAKSFGARVIAVDLNDNRLESSKKFGAEYIVNPKTCNALDAILEITSNRGVDKVIECSGSKAAIISAIQALKLRGRLVQVGVCPKIELNAFEHIIKKEIEIVGSRNFNDNELEEIIEFVRNNPIVQDVITHRFTIDEAEIAFETAQKGEGLKVIIKP
jgi:2-desacetyl-2-hydroxyethyl bacteriochlorophyllide A dehydrogenase